MSTKFYLRNPSATSQTTITVRTVWKNNQMSYSTGKKTLVSQWRIEDELVYKSHPSYSTLNTFLKKEKILVDEALTDFELTYGTSPDPKQFKKHLKDYRIKVSPEDISKLKEPIQTLYSLIDILIDQHKERLKNKGVALVHGSYCSTLKQTSKALNNFEKDVQFKVDFETIDLEFYHSFLEWCYTTKGYSVNYTGKLVKTIKRVMNEANDISITENLKHKSSKFVIPTEKVFNVYLDEEELHALYSLDLKEKKHLDIARDLFLVGCWTGLRISDVKRIKEHNVVSKDYVKIRTQKTGTDVEIPLNAKLKTILEKHDFKLPSMPDQNINEYIKTVCKMAGIEEPQTFEVLKNRKNVLETRKKFEMVVTHTARRSFATNRYEEGLDVITIMAITGHTTETSFMTYIKTQPKTFRKKLSEHYRKIGKHLKVISK
jgi:integrase